MSTLASPNEQINSLTFHPLKSGTVKNPKCVVVQDKTMVVVDQQGRIFTNALSNDTSYSFGYWPFAESLLNALVKAKVLPASAKKEHLKAMNQRKAERDRQWNTRSLMDSASALGIKLTASQSRQIESLKNSTASFSCPDR